MLATIGYGLEHSLGRHPSKTKRFWNCCSRRSRCGASGKISSHHPNPSQVLKLALANHRIATELPLRSRSEHLRHRLFSVGIRIRLAHDSTVSCIRSGSAFTFSSIPWTLISPKTTVRSRTGLPRIAEQCALGAG